MSNEVSLTKPAETPANDSRDIQETMSTAESRRGVLPYLAAAVGAALLVGGFTGWSKYRAHAAESCEQTFDLPMDGSAEPVLKAPDGTSFKLRVGQVISGDSVELGFLAYGKHEKPSMFDLFGGKAAMASVSPADIGPGPEAIFSIDDHTKLHVDVTAERVQTQCVPTEVAAGVTSR